MTYFVEVAPRAIRDMKKLPKRDQRQIAKRIDALAENPFPEGYKKLHGKDEYYRVRAGDYRIIYRVLEKRIEIYVLKIGHRREVYR